LSANLRVKVAADGTDIDRRGCRPAHCPPRPQFDTLANGPWLGLMGVPGYYTERGRRFDSVVKYLSGGDLPLRLEGLLERYVRDLNPREPGPGGLR
jgi:hypothetical protein